VLLLYVPTGKGKIGRTRLHRLPLLLSATPKQIETAAEQPNKRRRGKRKTETRLALSGPVLTEIKKNKIKIKKDIKKTR